MIEGGDALRLLRPQQKHLVACCNAVDLDGTILMNGASSKLQAHLRGVGFTPEIIPLSEFMKAGGAAKCLTLKLVEN